MKQLSENFLSHNNILNSSLISNEELTHADHINALPEDIILHIFGNLSTFTLCQLSLVCKTFVIYAKKDLLWQNIAESILFKHEMAKPAETLYKDYCKDWLTTIDLGEYFALNVPCQILLKPRDPHLLKTLKTLNIPNLKLLSLQEIHKFTQSSCFQSLLEAVSNKFKIKNLAFHYIAQQQINKVKIDILNTTSFEISFNSQGYVLINNQLTSLTYPQDCKILTYTQDEHFYIYHIFERGLYIDETYCHVHALTQKNLILIMWNHDTFFSSTN